MTVVLEPGRSVTINLYRGGETQHQIQELRSALLALIPPVVRDAVRVAWHPSAETPPAASFQGVPVPFHSRSTHFVWPAPQSDAEVILSTEAFATARSTTATPDWTGNEGSDVYDKADISEWGDAIARRWLTLGVTRHVAFWFPAAFVLDSIAPLSTTPGLTGPTTHSLSRGPGNVWITSQPVAAAALSNLTIRLSLAGGYDPADPLIDRSGYLSIWLPADFDLTDFVGIDRWQYSYFSDLSAPVALNLVVGGMSTAGRVWSSKSYYASPLRGAGQRFTLAFVGV